MLRGCFCDCFGPFKWPGTTDDLDKEADPEDVRRALSKVRAYEERQRMNATMSSDVYRPLVVPSVSSGCAAPYDQVIPPAMPHNHAPIHHPLPSAPPHPTVVHQQAPPPPPRPSSPPPAYSSHDNLNRLTTNI